MIAPSAGTRDSGARTLEFSGAAPDGCSTAAHPHDVSSKRHAMIIVTGTKRSGTSMWMQVLAAAGFPVLGTKFMRNWESTIKDANPHGFYESLLRRGIYFATNPHPKNGVYLRPDDTRQVAVKVFASGLARSDLAYVDKVLVTMRPWQEYVSSLGRLYEMEHSARIESHAAEGKPEPERPPHLDAHLEWWLDNYLIVRDIATRGYPARITTYPRMLSDTRRVLSEVLGFLGAGDLDAALATVKPETRTQTAPDVEVELPDRARTLFDRLFETVDGGAGLSVDLIAEMNEVHAILLPEIEEQMRTLRKRRRRRAPSDPTLSAAILLDQVEEGIPSSDSLAEETDGDAADVQS
ncbi:MAG: hypothetical protein ACI81R_000207 [Bradymonadia bacterium]